MMPRIEPGAVSMVARAGAWRWLLLAGALPLLPQPGRAADNATATQTESVVVKARRLLLKEKNSPSAVTELGTKQIAQEGSLGSTSTLLRQAPSVYVYQSGPGENAPVLSIRGTRGLEVADTLDGVPMQDLLNGGTNNYLSNRFTLDQIDSVSIYPGVAYPDKNTFGTIGGTVAYTTKRSTDDFGVDVFGSIASFNTYESGVEINTGQLDGPLGSGANAPKMLFNYSNLQSAGYIQYSPAHYNNFEYAFDKPYDDGLSKFQATVLYNEGNGALQGAPTPSPLLDQYGRFSNYPPQQLFMRESSQYLTAYIKNDTYINDNIDAGFNLFYRNSQSADTNYENPDVAYNGSPPGTYPVVNVPYNFQYPDQFGIGPGYYYVPGHLAYNPSIFYNNPKYCPPDVLGATIPGSVAGTTANASPCGLNASSTYSRTDSYGFQPHVTLILPFNTIKLGGLVAKETEPTPTSYVWGTPNVPAIPGYNQLQFNGYGGGSQRTIYQVYAQDKVDLLDNTLHITPGITAEGTYSSNHANDFPEVCPPLTGPLPAACQTANPPPDGAIYYIASYKLHKFDRDYLPFFNISYDFDKVLPALAGTSVYASYGTSALFAPTNDFGPTTTGGVPYASIVHMYEAGIKYDTSKLLISADWFYQKVDRDFGFYAGSGNTQGQNFYGNSGQREFKGFEAAITYQVTPAIQIFGNGSYLNAKYLVTQPTFSTIGEDQYGLALKDTPISGVPAFLANFGVDYEAKNVLRDNDAFSARFSGQFTGAQYTTYDLSITQVVPPYPPSQTQGDTVTNVNYQLPAFTVYNLLLDYTLPTPELPLKHLKFELNLQNIFNERYWQYYYSQIPPVNGEYLGGAYEDGLPGEPFSATFTIHAKF
jgi:iron complex outermembrane receptor protein